jgi:hypothetical protein
MCCWPSFVAKGQNEGFPGIAFSNGVLRERKRVREAGRDGIKSVCGSGCDMQPPPQILGRVCKYHESKKIYQSWSNALSPSPSHNLLEA